MRFRNSLVAVFAIIVLLSATHALATAQIPDRVHIGDETYSLIGVAGKLPTPETFGIEASFTSTANWRGYYAEYSLIDDRLLMTKLTVNSRSGEYPKINGVAADMELGVWCPGQSEDSCMSDGGVYVDLDLPVDFTGKLRIATGFIDEYYVHMGFQKPSAFRVVLDLVFRDGVLVETIDRSEEAAEIRGQFHDGYWTRDPDETVERAFSLEMEPLE